MILILEFEKRSFTANLPAKDVRQTQGGWTDRIREQHRSGRRYVTKRLLHCYQNCHLTISQYGGLDKGHIPDV